MSAAESDSLGERLAHGAVRGTIAAMAMSGVRELTQSAGLVEKPPPDKIIGEQAGGLIRKVPEERRAAVVELLHWGYGAGGGVAFGALPAGLRLRRWSGPVYGLATWLGFELALAPLLGLSQGPRKGVRERVALALDHLLYGFVLSETRRRPQG